MKKKLAMAAAMVSTAALSSAAFASITVSEYNSTTANPGTSSFPSALPTPNAANTTLNGSGPTNNMSGFTVSQGPGAGSDLNPVSWGQSFEAQVGGTLTDIEFIITGTPPATFNLALYDAGSAGTTTPGAAGGSAANASPLSDTGANGYTGSGGFTGAAGTNSTSFGGNGNGTTPNGGHYINTSLNLLSSDSTGVTMTGYGTNPNATGQMSAVFDFHMSGTDAITLLAGEEYVFELSGLSGSIFFDRNAATSTEYPYGQAFIGQDPLNGNNNRDFVLGIVVAVPEPASASMVALGSLGLLMRRRNTIT
jgi:hypothetical protein